MDKIQGGSVTPAYGRKYRTNDEAIASFRAGKDFVYCLTEQYCSIRDFEAGAIVEIRHQNKLAVTTV